MILYVIKLTESALMNSHGFKGCDWAVCQVGTGEVLMCYRTAVEAGMIVRQYSEHPVTR